MPSIYSLDKVSAINLIMIIIIISLLFRTVIVSNHFLLKIVFGISFFAKDLYYSYFFDTVPVTLPSIYKI